MSFLIFFVVWSLSNTPRFAASGQFHCFIVKEIKAAIDRSNTGKCTDGYFNLVYQPLLDDKERLQQTWQRSQR